MTIKATINSVPKTRVSINNQQRSTVRAVAVTAADAGVKNIADLRDVDASDVDNNETLVYDEVSGKFVVKAVPIIDGGLF